MFTRYLFLQNSLDNAADDFGPSNNSDCIFNEAYLDVKKVGISNVYLNTCLSTCPFVKENHFIDKAWLSFKNHRTEYKKVRLLAPAPPIPLGSGIK